VAKPLAVYLESSVLKPPFEQEWQVVLGGFQSTTPKATGKLCQHSNEVFDELSLAHWSIAKELETPVGGGGGAFASTGCKRDSWATGAGAGALLACGNREGAYSSSVPVKD